MSGNKVCLNLYDLIPDANKALRLLGTGAFHGAIEVYGLEWSYGFTEVGSGIFSCPPKGCQGATFRESIEMGTTKFSEKEVAALLEKLKPQWRGMEYDLLRQNCCSFSNAFCQELGCGPIPKWVNNLAGAGATLGDGLLKTANVTHSAAIIAAAKAGEINAKYQITGTATAKASEFIAAMQALEREHQLGAKTQGFAQKVAEKAGQLDKQYQLSERASLAGAAAAQKAGELDRQYKVQEGVGAAASQASSLVQQLARQSLAASQAAMAGSAPSGPPTGAGQQKPGGGAAAGNSKDGCLLC